MGFEFTADVTVKDGANMDEVMQALKELRENEVLVGIPEEKASRPDAAEPSNVELLYIHTNGSPLNNIPARPVIEPAFADAKDRLGVIMKEAAKLALSGDAAGMMNRFKEAGLAGEAAAKNWFLDPKNGWPPNSASTAKAKERKTRVAAKVKPGESVVSNPKPLIDTGELRRSITFVVRRK